MRRRGHSSAISAATRTACSSRPMSSTASGALMADEDLEWSDDLLRSFRRSAFRFETRSTYALSYEQADFDRFLAGSPVPPPATAEGTTVSRVRVLDEPPSDYQRWELWAAPWHSRAGERIAYVSRSKAMRAMLPLWLGGDWW